MARPLRIEFAGAFYHVTARSNQRAKIFTENADRREWLKILAQAADRFRWRVYAYCQMDNHFHLLVETAQPNLSRCMRHLNGVYTQRFNRRHDRCGHLLQGRYHAVLIDEQNYLLEVARYIMLNPVRAGLVEHVSDWQWSGYRGTIGELAAPEWLATERLLKHFSCDAVTATQAFARFVQGGLVHRSPWKDLRQDIYLGNERFVELTQARMLAARRGDGEIPKSQRFRSLGTLNQIFTEAADVTSAVATAYGCGQFTMRQIADHLGVHYSTVSRLVERIEMQDCKTCPRVG